MNAQTSLFTDTAPVHHRRTNGQFASKLHSALSELQKWKTLYFATMQSEPRRTVATWRIIRMQSEEIIKLKEILKENNITI